ncbi:hypothetical protein CspeluHIS016_0308880 [Cutaneotrichosporon spelunceum]|uniref:Uncharacterized protein n=1 Tax=Cutaneotrichosporon spelunceum TaxID=1672016 RepID=A0AAD3TUW9_9TREE|nr:hypothetical protein CspeluHIS016_0308880 [Cutaneotrichosporon spelunceum]
MSAHLYEVAHTNCDILTWHYEHACDIYTHALDESDDDDGLAARRIGGVLEALSDIQTAIAVEQRALPDPILRELARTHGLAMVAEEVARRLDVLADAVGITEECCRRALERLAASSGVQGADEQVEEENESENGDRLGERRGVVQVYCVLTRASEPKPSGHSEGSKGSTVCEA